MQKTVYLLQPQNPSYIAKGDYIKTQMKEMGLADGGTVTRTDIESGKIEKYSVIVSADAYHFHEPEYETLCAALNDHHVISAPSLLKPNEADHATQNGITILIPEAQQAAFAAHIVAGTVIVVDEVSAAAVPNALNDLRQEPGGKELVEKIHSLMMDFNQWNFIYPPGHFTKADGSKNKDELTVDDFKGIVRIIETASHKEIQATNPPQKKGTVVICGGRVSSKIAQDLNVVFKKHGNIVIDSQHDYNKGKKPDLTSALVQLSDEVGSRPDKVIIDGLAGTTLKVVTEAGWQNVDLIVSERMLADGNQKRFAQVFDHYRQYSGNGSVYPTKNCSPENETRILTALGEARKTPPSPSTAPKLETALRGYLSACDLLPPAPGTASGFNTPHP